MSQKNSNPYDLKTKKDEGYLYEEKPSGYLDADELINFLNRRKILIDRADNLPRFANNNNIIMAKLKRVGKEGSTPTIYKIPTDTKIEEILSSMKNNNLVVFDRFFDSTYAYQKFTSKDKLLILNLINQIDKKYIPNITFYFKINKKTLVERKKMRVGTRKFITIDASRPKAIIHKEIVENLKKCKLIR